jgi:2-dehydro-3-deoxyphosphogluconate aldolase / (4S)-4-hydroxy-2-oxoglutarate aldolase
MTVLPALERAIVPVVVLDDEHHAVSLADALVAGGIRCAETTFRTSAGVAAIRRLAADLAAGRFDLIAQASRAAVATVQGDGIGVRT